MILRNMDSHDRTTYNITFTETWHSCFTFTYRTILDIIYIYIYTCIYRVYYLIYYKLQLLYLQYYYITGVQAVCHLHMRVR